jgi:hypothetical protein
MFVVGHFFAKSKFPAGAIPRYRTNRSKSMAEGKEGRAGIWPDPKYWCFLAQIIGLFACDVSNSLAARKIMSIN